MKKLNWGLIGCGDISKKRVAPALKDLNNCELKAVNRSNYKLAELFAKKFGVSKWYNSWEDLIVDSEIDAVYIATPVYLHATITIAASKAGKHVLCEKPMALNNNECELMINSCKKNNVKLGISYYRHFYPVVNRVKEIIANDEIGKVIHTQINAFEYFNPQPDEPRHWLLEKNKSGGGPMFDFGCHRIEVLHNLFGNLKLLNAHLDNVLFEREVEDTASVLFVSDNGATAELNVSHCIFEAKDTLTIFGSKGSIHVPVLNKGKLILKNSSGERVEDLPPHKNFHQPLINDFAEAVLNDREPLVNGETGKKVNSILSAIYS